LIERISTVLETEGGGAIKVARPFGLRADPHPPASPNNLQLSQARAKAVGDLLQTKLSKPDRITVEGKGADAPIADNASREGRAKNRRVEIVIQRQG
jgi:type VI secretion system protein ImpK